MWLYDVAVASLLVMYFEECYKWCLNFLAFKDVRANCFCASLLRTAARANSQFNFSIQFNLFPPEVIPQLGYIHL